MTHIRIPVQKKAGHNIAVGAFRDHGIGIREHRAICHNLRLGRQATLGRVIFIGHADTSKWNFPLFYTKHDLQKTIE